MDTHTNKQKHIQSKILKMGLFPFFWMAQGLLYLIFITHKKIHQEGILGASIQASAISAKVPKQDHAVHGR